MRYAVLDGGVIVTERYITNLSEWPDVIGRYLM